MNIVEICLKFLAGNGITTTKDEGTYESCRKVPSYKVFRPIMENLIWKYNMPNSSSPPTIIAGVSLQSI
ncbi:MAG: hypothetical protein ABIS36_12705 [Chryseolinea sp.]